MEILLTKKSSVEELNDVCEALVEKSACPAVRDQTVDLQKSYSSLLSNLQGEHMFPSNLIIFLSVRYHLLPQMINTN